MAQRPPALQKLLDAAQAAYTEFATDPDAKTSISRIFGALGGSVGELNSDNRKLPVCSYLAEALSARPQQRTLGALMDAFAELEPVLSWRRRTNYDPANASENFHDGHGNCMIVGPGGSSAVRTWRSVYLFLPRGCAIPTMTTRQRKRIWFSRKACSAKMTAIGLRLG